MQIAYGSPGHKGVTHLMAVGAAELEEGAADRAAKLGLYGSVAAFAVGVVLGSTTVRNLGLGGAIALWAVRQASGAHGRNVQVTTAPAPSQGW